MKCLRKLLCVAVATLWVLPVSALEWDQRTQALLDTMEPSLEFLEPMSDWIALGANEYTLFEAADYELHFELFNATLAKPAGFLIIEAFDATGVSLDESMPIAYTVDTTNVPFILKITSTIQQGIANDFVQVDVPMNFPATRRIQLRPRLIVSGQDCDQQARMRTWFRYDQAQVATDEPDDMIVPSAFVCP